MSKPSSSRLHSLDVFRGITIAGMILVNQASLTQPIYPWLAHAEWNGCTFADWIFPFFLFIIGVAMAYSLAKYTQGESPPSAVYGRLFRRCALLFGLGLFLNGFWYYDFSTLRIMGVLQRISLVYGLTALAILNLPRKGQWLLAIAFLGIYWLALSFFPVPDYGAGDLTRVGNFGAYVDRLIIPEPHLYAGDNFNNMGDPEGLFSTIPAVVSSLAGYFTGLWLRTQSALRDLKTNRQSLQLVMFGLSCLVLGQLWNIWFPINKKLWTSSYVLFTTGIALLLLAACYELIEVRGYRRWGQPFEILGLNSIFIFVASILLIKVMVLTHVRAGETALTTYQWIYEQGFQAWAGPELGSLLLAVLIVLFWFLVAYGMYRQKWLIKI